MPMLFRQLARHLVQKVASNPVAREKAARMAVGVAKQAQQIAGKPDRAYAAGKAVRRALNKLNNS
tara:strand:+ start:333 stop:527 length:195 start_codon:yes stop_codon:yes gene_type:complete